MLTTSVWALIQCRCQPAAAWRRQFLSLQAVRGAWGIPHLRGFLHPQHGNRNIETKGTQGVEGILSMMTFLMHHRCPPGAAEAGWHKRFLGLQGERGAGACPNRCHLPAQPSRHSGLASDLAPYLPLVQVHRLYHNFQLKVHGSISEHF